MMNAVKSLIALAGALTSALAAENHVISDLKVELLWVKPGTFTMGSPADEESRNKAEGPQTRVTLTKGFWLGKTEVTQEQYETLMGQNPSTFKNVGKDAPVENVSWIDAMAFCEKLNSRERRACSRGFPTGGRESRLRCRCSPGFAWVYFLPATTAPMTTPRVNATPID